MDNENNLDVEVKKAKEIQDEFGGDISIPSWMDDPDLFDFGNNDEVTEIVMNNDELDSIIDDVKDSNSKIVNFQNRYDEFLKNKLRDEYKRNKQRIEELNNSVSTTLVDRSSLSKLREAKQSILNKKGVFTDRDMWRLVGIMPQGFKEPLSSLINDKFKTIASTRRLTSEEISMLLKELDRFEAIIKPNIRPEEQEESGKNKWVINDIGSKEDIIDMNDIDVVYVVTNIKKFHSLTGVRTKDIVKCRRAKIENLDLTQAYIDLTYPSEIEIPTPANFLLNKAKAIKIVNRDIWREMGIQEKDSIIYILPYIKVNKMLIVIGDRAVYNEIKHDLNEKLEGIVAGNYSENVDYVRVINNSNSLDTISQEEEELNYNFKTYTNEELEALISENIVTNELINNINIKFPNKVEKPDKDNNENMKSEKLPGSIFIYIMNNIIKESEHQPIAKTYEENKAKIQRKIINGILPRVAIPNQISSLMVDTNYLLGDNSWFYNRMNLVNDNKKLEVLVNFLKGNDDELFKDISIDDILSIPSIPRKSKKKEFIEELEKRVLPYKDIIETDTTKKIKNISNVVDLISYHVDKKLRELDSLDKKDEVVKIVIDYTKGQGINTSEKLSNISQIQTTKEVNEVTIQQLIYSLEFNDNMVIKKSDIPFAVISKLIDKCIERPENKIVTEEVTLDNKIMDSKRYTNETMSILKEILNGNLLIIEPVINRIVDILVTDKLIESLESERVLKRLYNNVDIIVSDVSTISGLINTDKDIKSYVDIITSLVSELYKNNSKVISIFMAILNEEFMSTNYESAKDIVLNDLNKFRVDANSIEFKETVDLKLKELTVSKFIPFSFNEYQDYNIKYRDKIKELLGVLELKETDVELNVKNLKNLIERSNLSYAAYLRTGNVSYLKDINRDYVSADLLMYEDGVNNTVVGEFSPTALLEKYSMEERRDEFEDDDSFDYQSMILEIEKLQPNLKYTLPKPIVDFVENTEIVIPEDTFEYFTNGNTKFDIKIKSKGR